MVGPVRRPVHRDDAPLCQPLRVGECSPPASASWCCCLVPSACSVGNGPEQHLGGQTSTGPRHLGVSQGPVFLVPYGAGGRSAAVGWTRGQRGPGGVVEILLPPLCGTSTSGSCWVVSCAEPAHGPFVLIYKTLPDARIERRDVWIGDATTSVLFAVGNHFIALYLSRSGVTSAYGAAGSLIVVLLCFDSSQVFRLCRVHARHACRTGQAIEPEQLCRARPIGAAGHGKRSYALVV